MHLQIEVASPLPDGPLLQYSLPVTHGKFQPGQAVRIGGGTVRQVPLIKGMVQGGGGRLVGECRMVIRGGEKGGISDKAIKRGKTLWWGNVGRGGLR